MTVETTTLATDPPLTAHPDFAGVAERFLAEQRDGFGAQLCVSAGGEVVLDLADGIAPDAIMTVYSRNDTGPRGTGRVSRYRLSSNGRIAGRFRSSRQ
jgi:hypothetical protein